tara:strand:- start:429 stop:3707 length:3279 start_codon:yes stop_codon:yes gene_type:complete
MAITGAPFQKYVSKQIDLRQEFLGEGFSIKGIKSRSLKTRNVYNSSTPFMRLSSAVSITKGDTSFPGTSVYEQLENSGIGAGIGGINTWHYHNLARNFILQGAPNNSKGNANPSGVNLPGKKNVAYGWGYNASQINSQEGYIPPPGVTKVDFDYKSDGALAFATISIKAFSATQFSLIDILYMRPGYTCLLEFGHSMYYNNKKELVNLDTSNTAPFEYLFLDRSKATTPSVTYEGMSKTILKEKEKHDGNYEAFFARISKFSWKFNMDGSYDITVKLMGLGDVISSLKSNVALSTGSPSSLSSDFKIIPTTSDGSDDTFTSGDAPFIISDAQSTQLNFELFSIFATWDSYNEAGEPTGNSMLTLRGKSDETKSIKSYDQLNNIDVPVIAAYDLKLKDIPITAGGKGKDRSFSIDYGVVKIVENSKDNKSRYNPATFIKFGAFLAMLQKICNVTDGKSNTLIQFEMVSDIWLPSLQLLLDDTFLVTYPGNFSSNPNKCLIKYSSYDPLVVPNRGIDNNLTINNVVHRTYDDGEDNTLSKLTNPALAMRLSDVYININFITEVMSDLRGSDTEADNEVDISIIDLLKGILSGVNSSLGGLNNFRVLYSEDLAQIQIVSESPILSQKDGVVDSNTKKATINTFGFNTTDKLLIGGSFVTSVDLNSELTDQMATQISIGAQNNSNTVNGNSTAFSSYSKGLIDKLMTKKESTVKATSTAPTGMSFEEWELAKTTAGVDLISTSETIDRIVKILDASKNEEIFNNVYGLREFSNNEYISALEKITAGVAPLISGAYTQNGNSAPPFFLPFNMSLEMHGLAGMKIFNSFSINGRGLPISYNPSTIQLIIKSLSHTVSLNGWSTKIETLSRPVFDIKPTTAVFSRTVAGEVGNKLPPPPGQQPLEDEKIRIRLTRIMDDGIQTLGMMDVLAEDESTILYTLATVELPWKGNKNGVSCVPTDDYRVKSHIRSEGRKCFWLIGNAQGNYADNKLFGNGFIRSNVLIHDAPKAPGWLLGCIGPGFKFNVKGDQKGRQIGTGTEYLNPAKSESIQAVSKLLGTLYSIGSFKMEIKNLGGGDVSTLPKTYDAQVKAAAKSKKLI